MKAAVYHGRRDVRIEDRPDPTGPGRGEVVLEVLMGGICGTDAGEFAHGPLLIPLDAQHPASGHRGPVILGHEFVGRIVAVGPEVEGLAVGQRVVPGAAWWCGQCRWCLEGRSNLCAQYFVFGLHADGGLAKLSKVPARMCHVVSTRCSDDSAAMAQPLAIALHAVRQSGVKPGQVLAVIGVGGIGSLILAAALAQGISSIIAIDVDEQRLEKAARLGAVFLVNARREDPAHAMRRLTGDVGADVVIEASGAPPAPEQALTLVRRGGRVLLVGLQEAHRSLDLRAMVLGEIELRCSNGHVCAVDLPAALTLLATTDLARTLLDRVIALDALVNEGLLPLVENRAQGKILVAIQHA
jgi:(R,R)-butanediol dehydrogenase / meso-butanediol dehydrogenase / diacetyl reductase